MDNTDSANGFEPFPLHDIQKDGRRTQLYATGMKNGHVSRDSSVGIATRCGPDDTVVARSRA